MGSSDGAIVWGRVGARGGELTFFLLIFHSCDDCLCDTPRKHLLCPMCKDGFSPDNRFRMCMKLLCLLHQKINFQKFDQTSNQLSNEHNLT